MSWTEYFGGIGGAPFTFQLRDFALHKVAGNYFVYGGSQYHVVQSLVFTFKHIK